MWICNIESEETELFHAVLKKKPPDLTCTSWEATPPWTGLPLSSFQIHSIMHDAAVVCCSNSLQGTHLAYPTRNSTAETGTTFVIVKRVLHCLRNVTSKYSLAVKRKLRLLTRKQVRENKHHLSALRPFYLIFFFNETGL